MAKNPETARTEGYKHGINGDSSDESFAFEGWNEDRETKNARREGFEQGRRDRMRIDAERDDD